jgi:hypothetical protein
MKVGCLRVKVVDWERKRFSWIEKLLLSKSRNFRGRNGNIGDILDVAPPVTLVRDHVT